MSPRRLSFPALDCRVSQLTSGQGAPATSSEVSQQRGNSRLGWRVVTKGNEHAINVSAKELNILGPQRRDHSSGLHRFPAAGTSYAAQKQAAGLTPTLAII